MADGSHATNTARVSDIVSAMLAKREFAGVLDLSQDLRDAGLTSLDMVNLMLAIEAEFDIEFPTSQMTPDNFRSIPAICALVEAVRVAA
jgi:acyl carrier protein